jgi:hypothetical protein
MAPQEITQMNRLPFILSSLAVAILAAGCATESRVTSAPAPVVVAPAAAPYVLAPAGMVVVPQASTAGTVVVPQASPAGMVVVAPAAAPLRVGLGRIESILAVPSAAAGGTAPSSTKRIVMRMDDGSVQYFDTQAAGLAVGDRIEITKDGTMRHPA